MGARSKLNSAAVLGCAVIAALVGIVAQNWGVFLVTAAVLMICALHDGSIRPSRRR